jgi:hypothetical protein
MCLNFENFTDFFASGCYFTQYDREKINLYVFEKKWLDSKREKKK